MSFWKRLEPRTGRSAARRAAREAEEAEDLRQQEVAAGTQAVNQLFDSPERQGQVQEYMDALRGMFMGEAERQKADTSRQLRFALARGGLTGGSAAVDKGRRLGETFQRGALDIDRRVQGAGAELRSADEDARMSLLAGVQGGMDATSAFQRGNAQLGANLGRNQFGQTIGSLGNIFQDFGDFITRSKEQDEFRRGRLHGGDIYGRRTR